MDGDTFACGNCCITYTSIEAYARHKYNVHHLRFTLTKSFSQKPNVFFPALIKRSGSVSVLATECINEKEIVNSANRKERMTFNKQLMEEANTLSTGNQCNMCQRSFRNQKSLSLHQRNAHHIYCCDLCPEVFMGQESHDKHVRIHVRTFFCNICKRRYQSKAGLKLHLRKHKNLEDNASTLNNVAPVEKLVLFDNINQDSNNTDTPVSVPTSIQSNHHDNQEEETEPKKLQDFPTNLSQPNAVILCNVCNQFYKTASDLLQHLISLHITLTPHKCGLCNFSCTKRDILASHMLTDHSKELTPNTELDSLQVDKQGNLVIEASMLTQQSLTTGMDKLERQQEMLEKEPLEKTPQQACQEVVRNIGQRQRVDSGDNTETCESICDKTRTMEMPDPQITHSTEITHDKTSTVATQDPDMTRPSETEMLNIINKEGSTVIATRDVDASESKHGDNRKLCDNPVGLNQNKEDELVQAVQQLTAIHAYLVDVPSNPGPHLTEASQGQVSNLPTVKNQIICVVCQRVYKRTADLKVHMRKHTGERPYWCDICQKGFITSDSLQKHSVVHSEERRYKCGECGKLFKRMGHVRTHLLHTHSSEKTHICCICHKHFKTKTGLDVHLKRHTPTKPYSCPFCRKSFKEKGTLVRHIRTHTGDKPYVCDKCGRGFTEGSVLRKHQKAKVPCTLRKSSNMAVSLAQEDMAAASHKTSSSQTGITIETELPTQSVETENQPPDIACNVAGIEVVGVAEEGSTDYQPNVNAMNA